MNPEELHRLPFWIQRGDDLRRWLREVWGEVPPPHPLPYYNSVIAHFFSRNPCVTAPEDQRGSPGRSDPA